MPLKKGCGTASENISEMVRSGYPQKQAEAASLSNERRTCKRKGGRRKKRTGRR